MEYTVLNADGNPAVQAVGLAVGCEYQCRMKNGSE